MPDEPSQQPTITQLAETVQKQTDPFVGAIRNIFYIIATPYVAYLALVTAFGREALGEALALTPLLGGLTLPLWGAIAWRWLVPRSRLPPESRKYLLTQVLSFTFKLSAYATLSAVLLRSTDATGIRLAAYSVAALFGLIGLLISEHKENEVAIKAMHAEMVADALLKHATELGRKLSDTIEVVVDLNRKGDDGSDHFDQDSTDGPLTD